MKIKQRILKTMLILTFALSLCAGALNFNLPAKTVNASPELVYKLDFADSSDYLKNNSGSSAASATAIGNVTYTTNAIQGKTAANLFGGGCRVNYLTIPGEVLNNNSVTVAGWFKMPSDIGGWARLIEIYSNDQNYLSVMPYAPNYYNALHINTNINGTFVSSPHSYDNMIFEGGDPNAAINTPQAGYILPVYDTWVHYAYQLTPTAFNLYQNGKLVKSVAGNFTASQFYSENAKIVLGATLVNHLGDWDMKASFADVRVYSKALTEAQISSEYAFTYNDFLTTEYNFENGVNDAIRGYNGALTGSASIGAENGDNVLVIDGNQLNDDWNSRSGMTIPSKTLHGHNSVTIAMDLYVDNATGGWARIFEFAPVWSAHWCVAMKWFSSTNVAMKYTNNNDHNDQFFAGEFVFDKWVHFAITIEDNVAKMYIDGKLIATSTDFEYKNSLFWEGNSVMQFGRTIHHNDRSLVGKMDDIKIYSTALSEKEIMIEAGLITIMDDAQAVESEKQKLQLDWNGEGAKINLPEYLEEGVKVTWESQNQEIITNNGDIIVPKFDTEVVLIATLSRGNATATKEITVLVKAKKIENPSITFLADIDKVTFETGSYYEDLMSTNLDYMMGLNKDRLLYNFRRLAKLDTKGVQSYGAWISPTSGGAGQFEVHYVIALAKASQSMPNYTYEGESVLERLTYMVNELKKCQDAYAALKPADAGYLGGISADHFHAIEEGRTSTDDGANIWVPWYFAHKTGEMLLDVYNYAASEELRATAWEMLMDFSDWASVMTVGRSNELRLKILRVEYGGMSELYYQIYAITGQAKHYNIAKFFEEDPLLNNIYENKDVLANLHSNTAIPKFLGAAAAYEATGDEYYKTVCVNAFEMIMTRTYANGGTSRGEHWQEAGVLVESNESCETCCSYNMLKLADYLYRWTGDKKYLDYFENVYTNHILASMAPDTGLKTYLTNTAFGYYKIYHTVDNSFWCCACTGMESFAKLTNGIYYSNENTVTVNMFYPSRFKVKEDFAIVQSGDFYTQQKTTLTVEGSGEYTIALRLPDWAEKGFTVTVNGMEQILDATNGFVNLTRNWANGDVIEYSVPFTFKLDQLKGSKNSYAIKYGPILLVADLGTENVFDVQGSQLTFGGGYTGTITDKIVLDGTFEQATEVSYDDNGNIFVTLKTLNQGEILFRPFNQLFHSRYGMYFKFYDTLEEIDKDYTVKGNEMINTFDSNSDLESLREYSTTGAKSHVENGMLVTPVSGEHKYMVDLALSVPYVVQLSVAPYDANGAINGGLYLFASNVAKDLDQIKAYNVQIEKSSGSSVYTISLFKFDSGFFGSLASATFNFPEDGVVDLHVLVREDKCFVYVEGNRNVALEFAVDRSFITETTALVGIRSQHCAMKMDNFKIISAQFTEVGVTALANSLNMAKAIVTDLYTPATVELFNQAYANATAIFNDDAKTQDGVNNADKELRLAIANLVKRGNPANLKNAINSCKALDERAYTQTSWNTLADLLNEIKGVDLTIISEAEIENYENQLKNALFNLEISYSNKARLNALIETAEQLNAEDYTEESWDAFIVIVNGLKELGDITAREEDEACNKLLSAQLELVKKEVTVIPEDSTNGSSQNVRPFADCNSSIDAGSMMALISSLLGVAFVVKAKRK